MGRSPVAGGDDAFRAGSGVGVSLAHNLDWYTNRDAGWSLWSYQPGWFDGSVQPGMVDVVQGGF